MEELDEIISANKSYDIVYWLYVLHIVHNISLDETAVTMGPPMSTFIDKYRMRGK